MNGSEESTQTDSEVSNAPLQIERNTQNVAAQVEITNPGRQVNITWNATESDHASYYKVFLKSGENSEKIGEHKVNIKEKKTCFEKLKADTNYVAHVIAVGINDQIITESVSTPVCTNEVERDFTFDIETKGKPVIQTCSAITEKAQLWCSLYWRLPDIGNESYNFDCVNVRASVRKTAADLNKNIVLEVLDNIQIKHIELMYGETYMFEIACTYKDLDNFKLREAKEYKVFKTDIGEFPAPNVKWRDNDITVSWKAAEGAISYTFKILNEKGELIKDEKACSDTEEKFPMKSAYSYGKKCTVLVKAYGKNDMTKESQNEIVIGGDNAVTDVEAYASNDREITVEWVPPKKGNVSKYEVKLYHEKANSSIQSHMVKDVCSFTFKNMKANTAYYCKVTPERDRTFKNGSLSNTVETNKVSRNPTFDIKSAGKPKIQKCKSVLKDGKLESCFCWTFQDIGKEACNYSLDTKAFVSKQNKKQRKIDLKTSLEAKPEFLEFGESYKFFVICTYTDLDTKDVFHCEDTRELDTDICAPVISDISWEERKIKIDWQPAKGASTHHLSVTDDSGQLVHGECKIENCKHVLKMTKDCAYGRRFNFIITASGGKKKIKKYEKKVLIGGDEVCTEVTARIDTYSKRAIVVTWKSPETTPDEGYSVKIMKMQGDKGDKTEKEDNIKDCQSRHKFEDLKTETRYICGVFPKYKHGKIRTSYSNVLETDKRTKSAIENHEDFGTPERIFDDAGKNTRNDSSVELSWSTIHAGENYKIAKFHISVSEHGENSLPIYNETLSAEIQKVTVKNVRDGHEYEVKFTTVLVDLDNNETRNEMKKHHFYLKTSTTNVKDCKTEKGLIKFIWDAVDGGQQYCLTVKDELSENDILKKTIDGRKMSKKECEVIINDPPDQLCVGRTYMTKIITHGNGFKSESDWKPHLIGGGLVPRNVRANAYAANPQRCIMVTFDAPKEGLPDDYTLQPIPNSKIHKQPIIVRNSPAVVEYLKQDKSYKFLVSACYGNEYSAMSQSNTVTTRKKHGHSDFQNVENVQGNVNFDFREALVQGGTTNSPNRGQDFGQVRDIRQTVMHKDSNDFLELIWKIPSFGNDASDYKVANYEVEIRKTSSDTIKKLPYQEFIKNQTEYSVGGIKLDFGEKYEISISTNYIDIDQDVEHTSTAAKETVVTRPCRPEVTTKQTDEKLIITWNYAKGTDHYVVNIHTDKKGFEQPTVIHCNDRKTYYERKFDEKIGFGITYFAVIEAIGSEGKQNSGRTENVTIGGDYVPIMVKASITHDEVRDPSTQVHLAWHPPKELPVAYLVTFASGENCDFKKIGNTEGVVSALKAGTDYTFMVKAIYKDENNKEQESGGCLSDEIKTSPKPTQVQNVQTEFEKNASTSVIIKWDEVEIVKTSEKIKYRVVVMTSDKKTTFEMIKTENHAVLSGLVQGTEYFATVAAGNSDGFGKNSLECKFKTAFGKPRKVDLVNNEEAPSSELILRISGAEGKPRGYHGSLHKSKDQVGTIPSEVGLEHIYKQLEPNTKYYAEVFALFEDGKSESVRSEVVQTAPAKPEIIESGCISHENVSSSKEMFIKWETITDCSYYEVRVIFEGNGETEKNLIVNNDSKVTYSCQREACKYEVQVRTKNILFSDWSDKKTIELGPSVLQNVEAKRAINRNLTICCKKNQTRPLQYCMQALCNDVLEGDRERIDHFSVTGDVIEFDYSPQKCAQKYSFQLWAETPDGLSGKRICSNTVISRPARVENVVAYPAEGNPDKKIKVCWDSAENCDFYEVWICCESSEKRECLLKIKKETKCEYICKHPGAVYMVRVCGLHEQVSGEWSQKVLLHLAPSKIRSVKIDVTENLNVVKVTWEPLKETPEGYEVVLYQDGGKIHEEKTSATQHKCEFKYKVKSGSICYCTVTAYNISGSGKLRQSKEQHIAWPVLEVFEITRNENDPSRKADIVWRKPDGVNRVKLTIENSISGYVKQLVLQDNKYIFDSGIPGYSYDVRLYLGNETRYAEQYSYLRMTMAPGKIENLVSREEDGMIIYKWDHLEVSPREYKIEWKANNDSMIKESSKKATFRKRVVQGAKSYIIKVAASNDIGDGETAALEHITAVPKMVENLRSEEQNGAIVYKWNALNTEPDEYIVQWRVDNESITEESTEDTEFVIRFVKAAHSYSLRVKASNVAGNGKMNKWKTHITAPLPPRNVKVRSDAKSPKTSFYVKYEDEIDHLKEYRVTAVAKEGDKDVEKQSVTTKKLRVHITGLEHGKAYFMKVQTIFCGKKSEEIFYESDED